MRHDYMNNIASCPVANMQKIIPVLEALEKWALEYEDALIADGNITGSSK